jgi:large subunit ribosomal protein L9
MEIILLENILNLGKIGEKVKVKNGYGRNFLLKKGKALRFSKENLDLVNKKKIELIKKNSEAKNQFEKISKIINKKVLTFNQECKENGELYGSIKPKQITNLIKTNTGVDVAPSLIILKDELNKIGSYAVIINFHPEVKASITIKIDKIKSN